MSCLPSNSVNTETANISCTVVTSKNILPCICVLILAGVGTDPVNLLMLWSSWNTIIVTFCYFICCNLSLSSSFSLFLSLSTHPPTQGVLQELHPSVPRGSLCQRETLVPSSLMTCLESCCGSVYVCMFVYAIVYLYTSTHRLNVCEMHCTITVQREWQYAYYTQTLWIPHCSTLNARLLVSTFSFYCSKGLVVQAL